MSYHSDRIERVEDSEEQYVICRRVIGLVAHTVRGHSVRRSEKRIKIYYSLGC